VNNKTFFPL